MQPSAPPKAVAIEVVATQPTETDSYAIAQLAQRRNTTIAPVTYLVKVRLDSIPEATSHGWALYVDTFRIPKYWAYNEGVYFKVVDPQFFEEHKGQPLRFSQNGTDFVDAGVTLAAPATAQGTALPDPGSP